MTLSRCFWFVTFVVVKAQKPSQTNEASSTSTLKSTLTPTQFQSYNPNEVCFNPQYNPYFENNVLSTCPVPKPNIYLSDQTQGPQPTDLSFQNYFQPFVSPWPKYFSKNLIPLVYIPSIPTSGRMDRRMLRYLRKLKKALNENPLLATKGTSPVNQSKKHIEIKFGNFPSAETFPTDLLKSTDIGEQKSSKREAGQTGEEKSIKIASYLIDYGTQKRKREDITASNVYPLPKLVYGDDQNSEPSCIYNFERIFGEIYN